MTATVVNGLAVVGDKPTEAPLRNRAGGRVVWQQTRTLLLADGSTVYGCAHCDYTNPNVNSIRPHLNKHRTDTSATSLGALGELTLDEITRRLATLDETTAALDEWKRRALAAERSLSTLRRALRDVAS